jgi:tRNA-Thr(GGU) m(6)t(6)A37 methyltransferase TsaA
VELYPQYAAGLKDLEGFSHVHLLFLCDRAGEWKPEVVPFLDDRPRGLFATRAPSRPNPIGLSVVRLEKVEGTTLHVRGLDILDGTPLLDVKPYIPEIDQPEGDVRTGWLKEKTSRLQEMRDDGRFRLPRSRRGR